VSQPGARPLAFVQPEQKVGGTNDCAGALIAGSANSLWHGVIGAMGKRVAVYDKKRLGHLVGRLFSMTSIHTGA
jgi:hypothetical protein